MATVEANYIYLLVTGVIGSFQVFMSVMLMTEGPNFATTTVAYLIYNTAFRYFDFGLASAMSYLGRSDSDDFRLAVQYFSTDVEY